MSSWCVRSKGGQRRGNGVCAAAAEDCLSLGVKGSERTQGSNNPRPSTHPAPPPLQYETMHALSPAACLFCIAIITLGNYVVMNLFLAVLLDNFSSSDGASPSAGSDTLKESAAAAAAGAAVRDWLRGLLEGAWLRRLGRGERAPLRGWQRGERVAPQGEAGEEQQTATAALATVAAAAASMQSEDASGGSGGNGGSTVPGAEADTAAAAAAKAAALPPSGRSSPDLAANSPPPSLAAAGRTPSVVGAPGAGDGRSPRSYRSLSSCCGALLLLPPTHGGGGPSGSGARGFFSGSLRLSSLGGAAAPETPLPPPFGAAAGRASQAGRLAGGSGSGVSKFEAAAAARGPAPGLPDAAGSTSGAGGGRPAKPQGLNGLGLAAGQQQAAAGAEAKPGSSGSSPQQVGWEPGTPVSASGRCVLLPCPAQPRAQPYCPALNLLARHPPAPRAPAQTPRPDALDGYSLCLFGPASRPRAAAARLTAHPRFEAAVLLFILLSSIALALDSPGLDPDGALHAALRAADVAFVVLFASEAALKVLARGFAFNGPSSYLRSPWNALDFVIVLGGGCLQQRWPGGVEP
jgi:hypothetical protein